MARRGRPKKPGPRFPGGQLKPESAGITATALQRLRALGSNPLLETQVGRLLFLEELRPIDAQTAFRIAEIYGRYDRALGRRRGCASPSYEVGRGRDTGLHESDSERARAESAARRFGALQAEMRLCPRGVKGALEELCVEDRPCPPGWLPAVRIALDILAVPLGIRRMRRSERLPSAPDNKPVVSEQKVNNRQLEREAFVASIIGLVPQLEKEAADDLVDELFKEFKARYERERFRLDKERK
jgi:hypothetical protein